MVNTTVFKSGVSLFVFIEICFLGGLLFVVVNEYDPFFEETVGLVMIGISIIAGMAVLLYELRELFKWKPSMAPFNRIS